MPKYNFCITRLLGLIASAIFLIGMFSSFGMELGILINIPLAIMIIIFPLLLLLAFGTSKAPKFFLACIYSLCFTPAEPDADIEALANAGKWIALGVGIINLISGFIFIFRDLTDIQRVGHGIAYALIGLIYATLAMLFMYLIQFSHR